MFLIKKESRVDHVFHTEDTVFILNVDGHIYLFENSDLEFS